MGEAARRRKAVGVEEMVAGQRPVQLGALLPVKAR
jgi:hypothetical protein